MSRPSKTLLEEQVELLARHFGQRQLRAAIEKLTVEQGEQARASRPKSSSRSPRSAGPTIGNALELIRYTQPEKYGLLSDFFARLKARQILPEAEDIRYFAQLVGLKEIRGKSRKDMIPTLMRFLIDRDTDTLRTDIQRAATISQQERSRGFSVLTDKLVGENDPRH